MVHIINYFDASFVYDQELLNKRNEFPQTSASVGLITKNEKDFIELSFVLDNKGNKKEGLVIPKRTIKNFQEKYPITKIGDFVDKKISIDWIDVNKFYDGFDSEPTKMYTEGTLKKFNENYLIVEKPETINIIEMKNHPIKKPELYFIPLSLIMNIKDYE